MLYFVSVLTNPGVLVTSEPKGQMWLTKAKDRATLTVSLSFCVSAVISVWIIWLCYPAELCPTCTSWRSCESHKHMAMFSSLQRAFTQPALISWRLTWSQCRLRRSLAVSKHLRRFSIYHRSTSARWHDETSNSCSKSRSLSKNGPEVHEKMTLNQQSA